MLDVATHLFDLGLYDDALLVLERRYGEIVDPIDAEPGRGHDQQHDPAEHHHGADAVPDDQHPNLAAKQTTKLAV